MQYRNQTVYNCWYDGIYNCFKEWLPTALYLRCPHPYVAAVPAGNTVQMTGLKPHFLCNYRRCTGRVC